MMPRLLDVEQPFRRTRRLRSTLAWVQWRIGHVQRSAEPAPTRYTKMSESLAKALGGTAPFLNFLAVRMAPNSPALDT
jgi:hypothetical protein